MSLKVIGLLACLAIGFGAGCANTSRTQTGQMTVSSMNNVSAMLTTVNARVANLVSATNRMDVQGVDKVAARRSLEEQAGYLAESAVQVRAEAERMQSLGEDYFDRWAQELGADTSGEAYQTSETQRQRYADLTSAMTLAADDFVEMRGLLEDLLGATAGTYSSEEIAPLLERIRLSATDAQNAISALQARLDEITSNYRSRMSS